MNKVGVVLAGGLSSRFGSPKAFALRNNKYFYEYAIAALQPYCEHIVIVTRPELAERFPKHLHVVTDIETFQGLGPLAGIYTAMEASAAQCYMIVPCDMPFLDGKIYGNLMRYNQEDAVAVQWNGINHPLVSIWHRTLKEKLKQALEERRLSVMTFLADAETSWIEGSQLTENPETVFKNINRQLDLERGE